MSTFRTAQRFLSELFSCYPSDCNLSCEIRCIKPGDEDPHQKWFTLEAPFIERAAIHAYNARDEADVYFGVLPREGRGAAAIHVMYASWLWVDIDAGTGSGKDCMDLLLAANLPKPHMVVLSGSGGGHVYWRLAKRLRLPDYADREKFNSLLRRIVRHIGGTGTAAHADKSAADIARVLRIPSTLNHKFPDPREVKLVMAGGVPVERIWFEANVPPEPVISEKAVTYAARSYDENQDAKMAGLRLWAERGYPEGHRHHDLTGAAAWLVRSAGVNKDDALELLKVKAARSAGQRAITERELQNMVKWA